jgi:phytoene dehydrogenase-like protein
VAGRYDVVVIGAGLGGLTAAGLLARAGRKVLVLERNASVGGAATTYKVGPLVVEASLHETADPHAASEPKNNPLSRLGVLDKVAWSPIDALYEVRGGPVGAPFVLPDSFPAARTALTDRFPALRKQIGTLLDDMERIATGLGTLSRGGDAFRNPREGIGALLKLGPVVRDWRRSLDDVLQRAFGDNEAAKWALAANLPYYHDDPASLWWIHFCLAQGGYLAAGGRYVRGGSQHLGDAIAEAIMAAGGEIVTERDVSEIRLDGDGRTAAVVHADLNGGDRTEVATRAVAGNAAPAVLAAMLSGPARERFMATYGARPLSMSILTVACGLADPPAKIGVSHYATVLVPGWIEHLADYRLCAAALADAPLDHLDPPVILVDYSAIDSGLGGPPYPAAIVAIDRTQNWSSLDNDAYQAKRKMWGDRLIAAVDRVFPGFAANVVISQVHTARSVRRHLNAPDGAVYGFAPTPPSGPIWRGFERQPRTPVPGLYLASAYGGSGGFSGAIVSGASAADLILAERARY